MIQVLMDEIARLKEHNPTRLNVIDHVADTQICDICCNCDDHASAIAVLEHNISNSNYPLERNLLSKFVEALRKLVAVRNTVTIKIGKYGAPFEVLTLELYADESFKVCDVNHNWHSYDAGVSLEIL